MVKLPTSKMFALVHGVTGRIWEKTEGGQWLWPSVKSMKRSWDILKEAGIVGSDFEEHRVVEIHLEVTRV